MSVRLARRAPLTAKDCQLTVSTSPRATLRKGEEELGRGLSRVKKGTAAGVKPKGVLLWKVRGLCSERSLREQEEAELRLAGAAEGLQVKLPSPMAMPPCSRLLLLPALALLGALGVQSSSTLTVGPTAPW